MTVDMAELERRTPDSYTFDGVMYRVIGDCGCKWQRCCDLDAYECRIALGDWRVPPSVAWPRYREVFPESGAYLADWESATVDDALAKLERAARELHASMVALHERFTTVYRPGVT